METTEQQIPDDMVGDAIPPRPEKPREVRPDLSDPWYRPAKQYLRREQWNSDILHLTNKLVRPQEAPGSPPEPMVLRYVGLPGQHYFDVLSMGRICTAKNLKIDYLGFRTGEGAGAKPQHLSELIALSNYKHYTANSITYPDSITSIGMPDTIATRAFRERGPFDVVNLDVCGGVLHGNTTPLLNAVKHVLTTQTKRTDPWLLFVTTAAKPEHIDADVIAKFFSTVTANCERVERFRKTLADTAAKYGVVAVDAITNPQKLGQNTFLQFFTLALSKWLLANLAMNTPRSIVTLRSVFSFRNTEREDPEMLSLGFLVSPVVGGGADPSGLTTSDVLLPEEQYATAAVNLISASLDCMQDLDAVWHRDADRKAKVVAECEGLLRAIGTNDEELDHWRQRHGLSHNSSRSMEDSLPTQ